MALKVLPLSVHQQAAEKLRRAILSGLFKPGDRLTEASLCERLGVSRPLIREALRSLEAEKLITIVPNRGPIVPIISWQEAQEIYQVRAVLEGEAAASFAKRAAPADIKTMREALKRFNTANKTGNVFGRLNTTSQFYEVILSGCGNRVIQDILQGLVARITFLRMRSMSKVGRATFSAREMKKILLAVEAGDAKAARSAAVRHVIQACEAARLMYSEAALD